MTVRPERAHGLGRGLSTLIPQRNGGQPGPMDIAIDRIRPNPHQPRRRFDEAELATLTESVREHGILQPILVTETIDGYRLVTGERRLRAASAAGLERIPAIVRQLDDRAQLEVALIENLQREDLDAIEAARGFRRLIDEFGFSQDTIAARVGRARSTVANTLRLLELAPSVQAAVGDRRISEGHARALGGLSVDHQDHVLGTVVDQDLSVRQTEELVRRLREPRPAAAAARPEPASSGDPDLERVEEDLRRALGTKVSLARSRRGGRIVIEYYSDEELGRLYDRLTGGNA
ncbi:MAG: ParB family transcriptional regulator, chromosome partitioning protein [Chloroflexota bacterium]|nr:ParB family transcriptional regulator, chromosome partitioning protein [Chloroflexota bacterium]